MAASIVINQATLGAGTAGVAREDGVLAQLVTCSSGAVASSYQWTLVDVPIRSALVRGTVGTAATFTFTPDVKGTYLVSLRVNGSSLSADYAENFIAVLTSGTNTRGWRYQAAREKSTDNIARPGLGFPGNTNTRGWATNQDLQDEETEETVARVLTAVTTSPGIGPNNDKLVKLDPATGKFDLSVIPSVATPSLQDVYGASAPPTITVDATGELTIEDSAGVGGGALRIHSTRDAKSSGLYLKRDPPSPHAGSGVFIEMGTETLDAGLEVFSNGNAPLVYARGGIDKLLLLRCEDENVNVLTVSQTSIDVGDPGEPVPLNMQTGEVLGVAEPTTSTSAATRRYVDFTPLVDNGTAAAYSTVIANIGGVVKLSRAGAVAVDFNDLSASWLAGKAGIITFITTDATTALTVTPDVGVMINGSNAAIVEPVGPGVFTFTSYDGTHWFV